MAAEFYIVFDDPAWYEQNQTVVKGVIQSLATFKKNINDQEYWLRGDEVGGDWAYGARIFMRPWDILLEISSHPSSIIGDIKKLKKIVLENTNARVVDDNGERVDCYSGPQYDC